MANYKEEHIRNNRRLARQIVGGVALLLAVIGLFTVFGWVVSLLRSVLDDSDRRKAYEDNLLGPDYTVDDSSFSTDVFSYQYDEEKQGYLVPVTSSVAQYTPEVEKIWKADGKQYVTVGYIPTATNSSSNR